jgi:hypothetical protein
VTLILGFAAAVLAAVSVGVLWMVWRMDAALAPPSTPLPDAQPERCYRQAA